MYNQKFECLKGENGCAGQNNSYDIKLLIFEKWFKGAKSGTVPLGPQFLINHLSKMLVLNAILIRMLNFNPAKRQKQNDVINDKNGH